jgi:hypothetical protein
MRGKMGDVHPGEDKEAGIDGDLVKVRKALSFCPPHVPIPCSDMTGSRREAYARNRPAVPKRDVVEVLADRLAIAEVMVLLYKSLIEAFQRSAPYHEDGEWQKPIEGDFAGRIIDLDLVISFLAPLKPRGYSLLWGKGNTAFLMEPQKETPADHVFRGSIGLSPVPETTEFL